MRSEWWPIIAQVFVDASRRLKLFGCEAQVVSQSQVQMQTSIKKELVRVSLCVKEEEGEEVDAWMAKEIKASMFMFMLMWIWMFMLMSKNKFVCFNWVSIENVIELRE